MPIIRSILDTDLYKLTMQKAVLGYRQGIPVKYVFHNRRKEGKFNTDFMAALQREVVQMTDLRLQTDEADWLLTTCPWLGRDYIEYLRNYRFSTTDLDAELKDGDLNLTITGSWERTILWEVPLMALISELYFIHCDTDWKFDEGAQRAKALDKTKAMPENRFADFGTRRRRNFDTQNIVVDVMKEDVNFAGTSNVRLAMTHGVKPIGTMAHEWIMGFSALESLRHANRYALRQWAKTYNGDLGIALPDTFGTEAFFKDFDPYLARLFDGVRHDSGDPIEFGEKVIAHYKKLRIDPRTKSVVFTDGLDVATANKIAHHFAPSSLETRIRVSFGIGTHFTNDYEGSKPLNMVIKLAECDGIPVVKLSDVWTKAIGERSALAVAKWTFFNKQIPFCPACV